MYPTLRFIKQKLAIISCGLALCLTPMTQANEVEVLKTLNEMVKAKQYQQAYDYANQNVMNYGGEPRFDYLMGLAAINIKAYEESVFAFERAVINRPRWEQARFQLAKAYFHMDNLAASRSELVKIKDDSKDPEFTKLIERFIGQVDQAALNKKRVFKQVVAFSSGYDNNINSGTQATSIFLDQLGTSIPLAEGSREIEDTPFNLSYQAQYQEPLNQNALVIGQVGLYRTEYADTPAFERTVADVTLKYQDVLAGMTYQIGAFYRPMELDGTHYRDQYGYLTNWSMPIDANWSAGWQLGFGKVDSRISPNLDVRDGYLTVSGQYRTGRWQHTLAANGTKVSAVTVSSRHRSHDYFKLDYQAGYLLSGTQFLTFEAQFQKFNYDTIDPSFLIVRDEEFWRAGVNWRYMQNEWLMWQVQIRHSEKTSNEDVFAYDRDEVILGLTMQF